MVPERPVPVICISHHTVYEFAAGRAFSPRHWTQGRDSRRPERFRSSRRLLAAVRVRRQNRGCRSSGRPRVTRSRRRTDDLIRGGCGRLDDVARVADRSAARERVVLEPDRQCSTATVEPHALSPLEVGDARYQPSEQRPRAIRSGPARNSATGTGHDVRAETSTGRVTTRPGFRRTGRRRPSRSSARATTRSPGRTRSSSGPRTEPTLYGLSRRVTGRQWPSSSERGPRVRGRVRRFAGSLVPETAACPTSLASSSARAPVTQ